MNKSIKQNFIAGTIAVMPLALTTLIILWLFRFFANPGVRIVRFIFRDQQIPGYLPDLMGFLLTVLFIYILGLIIRNVIGRQLLAWVESIFSNIPIVNTVFTTIKQITSSIAKPSSQAFQKVVLVEYPRKGLWAVMMVTGESLDKDGVSYYHLFVPTTPNPTSGYMLIVKKTEVTETSLSVEEGMKMIISGGLIAPPKNDIEDVEEQKQLPEQNTDGDK